MQVQNSSGSQLSTCVSKFFLRNFLRSSMSSVVDSPSSISGGGETEYTWHVVRV
uniref:Uncharacterized protein n=1 Tax=Anguilla anguilla TaxID=7936 RepID=A0A0E9XEB0_ANGAN